MTKKEAIEKIELFRGLKQNWNGYNAEPISHTVINRAVDLVKLINPTPNVFPTGRNSIQLELVMDGIYFELEIYEDRIETYTENE